MRASMEIDDPTTPRVERWLRRQEPQTELAFRYCLRGRFPKAKANPLFNARVEELFEELKPDEDELAGIMCRAREIGHAIERYLGP
jgi:hypothetical protein